MDPIRTMRDARASILAPVLLLLVAGCTRAPDAAVDDGQAASGPVDVGERGPRSARDLRREGREAEGVRAPAGAREAAPATTLDDLLQADDTFDSLRARFGPQVVRESLPAGEGTEIDGWVLYPDDPARRVEIIPDDAGRHPVSARVGVGSRWQRADGVRPGIDTRELERLNGGPFEFTGFDWDYGGLVMDWKGGRLARPGHPVGMVQLCPPASRPDDYPIGDREFASSLPAVQANPATVCGVGIAFGTD